MAIALIVVIGLIIMTGLVGVFDFMGKRAQGGAPRLEARLAEMEKRLGEQEQALHERDEAIRRLEGEVGFMTNLLESKKS